MNRSSLRLAVALAALAGALCMPTVASAMVAPLTLQQLTDASTAIVRVSVGSETARALGDGDGVVPMDSIVTDSSLTVRRTYKGSKPGRFTFRQPGGSAEGFRLEVSDVPDLERGAQYVLFLDERGVVGGEQGALRIVDAQVPQLGISLAALEGDIREARTGELSAAEDSVAAVLRGAVRTDGATVGDVAGAAAGTGAGTDAGAGSISAGAVTAAATPVIWDITPVGANSGTGEQVTIVGSGFGSTPGRVFFPRGDAVSWMQREAPVVSWSDTAAVVTVPDNAQSGDVRLMATSGVATRSFTVGFAVLGNQWIERVVSYYVNENTSDLTGEAAIIRRAIETWNQSGADFTMAYSGASSASGSGGQDGKNDIFFTGSLGTGYLAMNELWYDSSGNFTESNLMISDTWRWADGDGNDVIDLETVVLHELGHTVGLGDQYMSRDRVMGAYVGSARRSLSSYEVNGAVHLYGASSRGRFSLGTSAKLVPSYNKPAYVSVRLYDRNGQVLTGQTVTLDRNGAPVTTLKGSVSDPGLYYGNAPVVKSKTTFTASWPGDATNGAASLSVTVKPKVKLSVNAPEKPSHKKKFVVKTTIKPAHKNAQIVLEVWKKKGSKYSKYRSYSAKTSKSSFSGTIKLPKGTYRVRAMHSDSGHASSASSYDYFKVK